VTDVVGARAWRVVDEDQTITRLGEGLARYDPERVQGHTPSRETVRRLLGRLGALPGG
jgi:hypothetical protein